MTRMPRSGSSLRLGGGEFGDDDAVDVERFRRIGGGGIAGGV